MDLQALSREEYLELPDDKRPHLYPDREPSNSVYTGTKNQPGCRCTECRSRHAAAIRKNRQPLQLQPVSVTDAPIPAPAGEVPADLAASVAQDAADAVVQPDRQPSTPEPAEADWSRPGAMSAEDVAREILREAVTRAGMRSDGALPRCNWMLSAPQIAEQFPVTQAIGVTVTRILGDYIKPGPGNMVYLMKRPVRI